MYKPCDVEVAVYIIEEDGHEVFDVRARMSWQDASEAVSVLTTLDQEKASLAVLCISRMAVWFESLHEVLTGENN